MQTGYELKTFALLTNSCVHLTVDWVTYYHLCYFVEFIEIYGDVQMQLDYYTL